MDTVTTAMSEREKFIYQHRGKTWDHLDLTERYDMDRHHIGNDELYECAKKHGRCPSNTPIRGPGVLDLLEKARNDPKLDALVKGAVRDPDVLDIAHHTFYKRHGEGTNSDAEALLDFYRHRYGAYEKKEDKPVELPVQQPSNDDMISDLLETAHATFLAFKGRPASSNKEAMDELYKSANCKGGEDFLNNTVKGRTLKRAMEIYKSRTHTKTPPKPVTILTRTVTKFNKDVDFPPLGGPQKTSQKNHVRRK